MTRTHGAQQRGLHSVQTPRTSTPTHRVRKRSPPFCHLVFQRALSFWRGSQPHSRHLRGERFRALEFLNRFHQPTHCGHGIGFQNLQIVNELHYIQLPLSGFNF